MKKLTKFNKILNRYAYLELYPEGHTVWKCPNCNSEGKTKNQYFRLECVCGAKVEIIKIYKTPMK